MVQDLDGHNLYRLCHGIDLERHALGLKEPAFLLQSEEGLGQQCAQPGTERLEALSYRGRQGNDEALVPCRELEEVFVGRPCCRVAAANAVDLVENQAIRERP